MKISVVINTYNAEQYLVPVLESVKEFDEILICDMHSTDKTVEIARQYGSRIIYHEHTGIVEPARNFAIRSAKYDWVLVLDADEVVPLALKDYLYDLIKKEGQTSIGLRISRRNFFMGRFMRCTYPDYQLRFFQKDKVEWPSTIHSQPAIDGEIRNTPRKRKDLAFIHLANETVRTNINKTNLYTDKEVLRRKKKKYGYFSLVNESLFYFFKFYFLKGAIWDKKAGLLYACLLAFYKVGTIGKVWESRYRYDDMEKAMKNK